MQEVNSQILITRNDFDLIMGYLKGALNRSKFNRHEAEEMEKELKKAKLVDTDEMPDDVVRLNSTVTIKDEKDEKIIEFTVVTPEKADIKQRKISILSPMGTALIGIGKGEQVSWNVPAGKKQFTILDVANTYV